MNYEIVNLNEKAVIGFAAKTSNTAEDMLAVIGGLWQKLYSPENFLKVKNRVNEKSLGIYTDYKNDLYTVITGFEVKNCSPQDGFYIQKIPEGKYAKFIVKGNMLAAVQDFWKKLWQMDLDRSFVCDFEEYQNADPENAEIHIYISLN